MKRLGLATALLAVLAVAGSPDILRALVGNRLVFFGLVIAELGLVFYLSARADRLGPPLEHHVQLRADEVCVEDEHRILDRSCREDLVEERLARRRAGADNGERLRPLESVRLREFREERIVTDQEPELPEFRVR